MSFLDLRLLDSFIVIHEQKVEPGQTKRDLRTSEDEGSPRKRTQNRTV